MAIGKVSPKKGVALLLLMNVNNCSCSRRPGGEQKQYFASRGPGRHCPDSNWAAVTATSASPERLFSSVGLVKSDLRGSFIDTTLIDVVIVTDTYQHIDRGLYTYMPSYLAQAYRLSINC
jgi:hypothetical protein